MSNAPPTKEVDRQCRAVPHCAASARLLSSATVCLGMPDNAFTLECEICEIFFCGGCAYREMVDVVVGDRTWFAWRFHCPRCASPISRSPGARLWSPTKGAVAELTFEKERLTGDLASRERIEAAATHHRASALLQLQRFNTAPTIEGVIYEVELATAEAPGEPLVWLYKAALCHKAGHLVAAQGAIRSFQRVRAGSRQDRLMALVSARSDVQGALAELRQGLPAIDADLIRRRAAVYNAGLARFDQRVEAYRQEQGPLSEFLPFVFPDLAAAPPDVRDFFEALSLENTIDFAAVEKDRAALVEAYTARCEKEDLTRLLARSVALRLGSISHLDFYAELFEKLDDAAVDTRAYPIMHQYRRYIEVTANIDPVRLHGAIWEEIARQYERLSVTGKERSLVDATLRADLVRRLFRYLDGQLGVARLSSSYASHPTAGKDLARSLSQASQEAAKPSLLERIRTSPLWRRIFGQ